MNHPCDGQTDRRTDGIAIAYARLAYMLSRAKTLRRFEDIEVFVEGSFLAAPCKQVTALYIAYRLNHLHRLRQLNFCID